MTLGKRYANKFLALHQSKIYHRKYSSCRWASSGKSSRFCFSLWSACICEYIRFQRKCFRLRLRGILLVVVVLLVDQVCDQLVQSMKNSDPLMRIVFVYRFFFLFPLHIYLARRWLWLLTRAQFWFSLESNLSCEMIFIFWQMNSRQATDSVNCKNIFSVFEILSDSNCCQESCITTHFNHTILLWESLSARSLYFYNRSSCARSSVEGVGVFITNNGSDWLSMTSFPDLAWSETVP